MVLFFNNDKEIKLNTIQILLVNKIIENNYARFVYFAEQGQLNLNFQDSCGNSLLHFAASYQNNDIVTWLLDRNVDPNQMNNENIVPLELYYAVETESFERLVSLTNRKTILKLTTYSDKLQRQLFWYAEHLIAQNRMSSLGKLLQAGFDINIRDLEGNGNTLLHKAAIYKKLEIMDYLIEKNAIPNIENNLGHVAQDYIEKPELISITNDLVDKLLNHEIDPFAIKKKSEEIILKAGGKILDWLPTIDLTSPRPLSEIIDRALVLNAMYQLCLKAPKNVIANWLLENDLIDNLSPDEYSILARYDDPITQNEMNFIYWLIEALWALVWVTKLIKNLPFDKAVGNELASLSPNLQLGEDGAKYLNRMQLRSFSELYEMRDLYYRLHWWVHHHQNDVPNDFFVRILIRRKALEWVLDCETDWDDVDLSC